MNTLTTKILSISFFILIISFHSVAQHTPPVWINTGAYVAPTFTLETTNRYVLGMLECKIKEDGTMGDIFTDWGSIVLSTDKNLNIHDSVFVKFIDDWYIMLYEAVVLNNGQILLAGPAYHPDSNEMKLGLIWMDESLNIVQQSLEGLEGKKIEPGGTITLNQAGNIVTYGKVVENYGSSQSANNYYFMEISQSGEMLQIKEQSLGFNAFYLWPVDSNKYHMWSWNNIVIQLDAGFNFENTFSPGWDNEFQSVSIHPYDLDSYFLLRDKVKFVPGQEDPVIEVEVFHVNNQVNPLNTFVFGFEAENTFGASLSTHDPDILYIGGTRNPRPYLKTSNQIFIYKTDIYGQIINAAFYSSNSGISCGNLLATSDGGCLIPVRYFRDYPSQDAFYLKMDADGNIVGFREDLPFQADQYLMFPNPVQNQFTLQSASGLPTIATIFSMSGEIIKSFQLETSYQVDVYDFRPGVYLMQLNRADGYRESMKVIITN